MVDLRPGLRAYDHRRLPLLHDGRSLEGSSRVELVAVVDGYRREAVALWEVDLPLPFPGFGERARL
jgi:hypothetical protein